MSVYVDELKDWPVTPKWRWGKACHLVADSLDELHAFAARLDLKRAWFQDGRHPHYDLTNRRRVVAVLFGAIEVDARACARISRSCAAGATS